MCLGTLRSSSSGQRASPSDATAAPSRPSTSSLTSSASSKLPYKHQQISYLLPPLSVFPEHSVCPQETLLGPGFPFRSVPCIEEPCLSGLPVSFPCPQTSGWRFNLGLQDGWALSLQSDGAFLKLYGRCLRSVRVQSQPSG